MSNAKQQLQVIHKMKDELARVGEALDAYEAEIKSYTDYFPYQSSNRGLIKHRIIDLKKTLTRLLRALYGGSY